MSYLNCSLFYTEDIYTVKNVYKVILVHCCITVIK